MHKLTSKIVPTNRHLQTVLGNSSLRRIRLLHGNPVAQRQEEIVLETNFGRLQGFFTRGRSDKLSILLHGWLGCADSTYIQVLAKGLHQKGHSIFRLNFRDHGGTQHLNKELFHSCRLDEVIQSISIVLKKYQHSSNFLIGFSLGGNFALRVASQAGQFGLSIAKIFCVSPAINPKSSLQAIEKSPIYRWYFIKKWRKSLSIKERLFPETFRNIPWRQDRSLSVLTEKLLLRYTQFPTVDEYFRGYAITPKMIQSIGSPTKIIFAADDPITPQSDIESLNETESVNFVLLDRGGHCGFIQGLSLRSWVEDYIADQCEL